MQGQHVTLWIYSRGEAARDLPWQLWRMVEDAGDWQRILWTNPWVDNPTRVSRFGDLVHWTAFMHADGDPKMFLLVSDNETGDIAGFIWFNRIVGVGDRSSAYGSIWMAPLYRGRPHVREAGILGLNWAHSVMGWKTVYTITPWPDVRNFDKRIGFREVAFVPKLAGPDVWLLEHVEGHPTPNPTPSTMGEKE